MENVFTKKDPLLDVINQVVLGEKKLTDAELKKREEIAKAMERENPGMDMGKKMAIATAQAKKVAEEVEELEERNKENAMMRKTMDAARGARYKLYNKVPDREPEHKTAQAHNKAIGRALRNEEVEELDELSKKTLGDYIKHASGGMKGLAISAHYAGATDDKTQKEKMWKRALKRDKGIKMAADKLTREDVELDEHLENFWGAYTSMINEADDQQQMMLLRAMAKDPSDLMKMKRAISMGDKALTNPVMRQEILKMLDQMMTLNTTDKALLQRTRSGLMKKKMHAAADTTTTEEVQREEAEQIDEISKKTLGSYIKKASTDREYRGELDNRLANLPKKSMGVIRGKYSRNAFDDNKRRLKSRRAGIVKAVDKLTKEEVEIDETTGALVRKVVPGLGKYVAGKRAAAARDRARGGGSISDDPSKRSQDDKLRVADHRRAKKYEKIANEEVAKDAPFEGGREVKSTKSAAERVKKIAKGMQKQYTKDKK